MLTVGSSVAHFYFLLKFVIFFYVAAIEFYNSADFIRLALVNSFLYPLQMDLLCSE